jgi:hypothetical protein
MLKIKLPKKGFEHLAALSEMSPNVHGFFPTLLRQLFSEKLHINFVEVHFCKLRWGCLNLFARATDAL